MRHITRGRVHADQVSQRLPWLHQLYRGDFLELAGEACEEKVSAAGDDRYGGSRCSMCSAALECASNATSIRIHLPAFSLALTT